MAHRAPNRILRGVPAFGRNNQLASREEFLANVHRLLKQAAWIPTQIEDQRLHALPLQSLQRRFQIIARLFSERKQSDVPDFIVAQRKLLLPVDVLHHVHIDHRAHEFVFLDPVRRRPHDRDRDWGARVSAQNFDGVRNPHLLGAAPVNFDYAITFQNARLETGSIFHRGHDRNVIVPQLDPDAQTSERSLRVILQLLVFFGVHEFAMRVQGAKHSLERAVNELLIFEILAINIILAHAFHYHREQFQAGVGRVLLRRVRRAQINPGADEQIDRQPNQNHAINHASFHKNSNSR